MKRLVAIACLSGACLSVACGSRALAADAGAAAAPIEALDRSLTAMEHSSANFAGKEAAIAPAVDGAFDLGTILANSIGLRYASIDPAQKGKLLATFRLYTIANYVANFGTGNATFSVVPGTRQSGADTVVQSSVAPATGAPTRIDYVMRDGGSGFKAVDVLLDGTMSRVAVQRSDFRDAFEQGGAGGLEQTLQRKIASLSGG